MDDDDKSPSLSPRAQQLKQELLGEFSLTVDDVAGILEVDRSTVYRYIQDGALAGLKIGREYRLSELDVKGFLEALITRERQRVNELRMKALTVAPQATPATEPQTAVLEPPPDEEGADQWGPMVSALYGQAAAEARARGQATVMPAHYLLALTSDAAFRRWRALFRGQGSFRDGLARQTLERLHVDIPTLRRLAEAALPAPTLPLGAEPAARDHSDEARQIPGGHALASAQTLGRRWVGTDAVLLALYQVPETAAALQAAGADEEAVRRELQRQANALLQQPATLASRFAARARGIVHTAMDLAAQGRSRVVTPRHLLLALASEDPLAQEGIARQVLDDLQANLPALRRAVEADLPAPEAPGQWPRDFDPEPTPALRTVVLERATAAARGLGHEHAGTEHLLLGLYSVPELAAALERAGAAHAKVRARIRKILPPKAPQPQEHRTGGFGRYSERSQKIIELAQGQARSRGTGYVGTQHLFLAMLSEEKLIREAVARKVLDNLGVDVPALRLAVAASLPPPQLAPGEPMGDIAFTPRGKALIMDHAIAVAANLGHAYVATEHLLLALYTEGSHAELLEQAGAVQEAVEAQIFQIIGGRAGVEAGASYDQSAQSILRQAQAEAKRLGTLAIHPGHVLLSLLADEAGVVGAMFHRLEVEVDALRMAAEAALPKPAARTRRARGDMGFTKEGREVVTRHATAAARALGSGAVGAPQLLLGLYALPEMAELLTAAGAAEDAVRVEVERLGGETRPAKNTAPSDPAGWPYGRYSERGQKAIRQSVEEARRFGADRVTPTHLLLACLADAGCVAHKALHNLGVDVAALRTAAEGTLPPPDQGRGAPQGDIAPTKEARAVVAEHAARITADLGHAYIGTEHLLLGLYAVPETAALLVAAGAAEGAVMAESLRLLGGTPS